MGEKGGAGSGFGFRSGLGFTVQGLGLTQPRMLLLSAEVELEVSRGAYPCPSQMAISQKRGTPRYTPIYHNPCYGVILGTP